MKNMSNQFFVSFLKDEIKYSKVRKLCVTASVDTSAPQSLRFEEFTAQKFEKFRIGVLGASGYTGSEVSLISTFYVFCSLFVSVLMCKVGILYYIVKN